MARVKFQQKSYAFIVTVPSAVEGVQPSVYRYDSLFIAKNVWAGEYIHFRVMLGAGHPATKQARKIAIALAKRYIKSN